MRAENIIRKYPVAFYFVFTFLISWGGVIAVLGSHGMPITPAQAAGKIFAWGIAVMLAGPFLTGLLMTSNAFGGPGFADLFARMVKWRVGVQWYAIALLTSPIFVGVILWILSQESSAFVPMIVRTNNVRDLLLSGITVGLAAGIFEEVGWTGFITPLMRSKRGVLFTGLFVGLLWGLWHVLVTLWVSGDQSGAVSMELLIPPLVFYAGVLPVYRLIMVWVYDRTGSLLISMLMHASLTTCTTSLLVADVKGMDLTRYYLVLSIALWVLAANFLSSRARNAKGPADHAVVANEESV